MKEQYLKSNLFGQKTQTIKVGNNYTLKYMITKTDTQVQSITGKCIQILKKKTNPSIVILSSDDKKYTITCKFPLKSHHIISIISI